MTPAGGRAASDIRLVLSDVDGTLVTHEKILTDRAVAAVQKLHDRGILFAITSGRPPKGMEMLFDPLSLGTPVAGFNGGLMVNRDFSVVQSLTLPPEIVRKTVALMREGGADVWIYQGNDWIVPDAGHPHVAREQWTVKFAPTVRDDIPDITDGVVKITGVSDDPDLMKRLEATVQGALGDNASAALSQPYYLDVTHSDANKGGVVRALSRLLDIPVGMIATLGDQPNDMPMFQIAGLSIAMGQAADAVKAAATYVSESSEAEGFAAGIERYILGES
ncbi:hydrolase [Acetobacter nitrogenifigens DSM 23921 = NBRC 105050]|uniref:Haloacid dehalogenase n=1 Tax=Acetobacter nitrogenifigens DSM 23921 = NBRC 105050 TaxID=1120919 RepID=A0A511XDR5_9PROT|nr:Cof-type HAD-IIB family hydrolase [Acetobacter nitrogenifigens]GBQ96901.1 hydrolase [Acetobacter nitrogenifigens DSM 23921 = NBRC 105050]GEN61087.1 haloacid dehalogenase [Acetobacter nitrogenifigens DSM 23921 = NBRC 105050]